MNSHFSPVPALVVSTSLFAAGSVFGGALHAYWTSKAAIRHEREPTPAISSADWRALKTSIARIEAQLANTQRSAPDERVEVGAPPKPSIDTQAQTVRELQASIDQLRLVADKGAKAVPDFASPHELDQASREVNSAAIAALVDLEAREEGAALRDVRFSTPIEILRRFGPPTNLGGGQTMTWHYEGHFDPAAKSDLLDVTFAFSQGCVVHVDIAR